MRALPDAIARRQAVLAETFAAQGFDETRMEDLAEAAGIPKATLYYHFAGKEEILAWLLRSTLSEMGEAVAKAAEGRVLPAGAWKGWCGPSCGSWPGGPPPAGS